MSEVHIANIGERGARRRRRNGVVCLVVGGALLVALLVLDTPRWSRLLVGVFAGLGATGLLQAREKT